MMLHVSTHTYFRVDCFGHWELGMKAIFWWSSKQSIVFHYVAPMLNSQSSLYENSCTWNFVTHESISSWPPINMLSGTESLLKDKSLRDSNKLSNILVTHRSISRFSRFSILADLELMILGARWIPIPNITTRSYYLVRFWKRYIFEKGCR